MKLQHQGSLGLTVICVNMAKRMKKLQNVFLNSHQDFPQGTLAR